MHDALIHLPQSEPSKWRSLALAALVHVLLIGALFFGVQWRSHEPTSVEVEVWRAAPPPAPVVKPEPRPEPKVETKPEPKPEPKPPVKPDIALKEKPKKEAPKKPDPKPEPEARKEKPTREVPDFRKELANDQKQLEQQKTLQDQRARAEAETSQRNQLKAEQATAARKRGLESYIAKIAGKIRGNIVLPPNIQGNPLAEFEVTQLPSGEVLGVKVRKSSGNSVLDTAIERAIHKSSPLPKPEQSDLFDRVLIIPYKPVEE